MTPLIHTSDGKAVDPSLTTWAKSAASGSTSTKEFDVLLSMLASIIGEGSVSASKAKTKTGGKTESSDSSTDPNSKTSTDQRSNSALSNLEEQLLEIITSGKTSAKGKGNSGNKVQGAAVYAMAGMPSVGVQPLTKDPEKELTSSSPTASSKAKEEASSALAMLDRDISAYLKGAADQSSEKGQSQTAVMDEAHSTAEPKKVDAAAQNQAVQKDLSKLLSASDTGKIDAKVLSELKAIIAEKNQGGGTLAKEIPQKLKGDLKAAGSEKTTGILKNSNPPSGSPASGGIKSLKDDPSGAVVADSKSATVNSSSKPERQRSQSNGVVDSKTKSVELKGAAAEQGDSTTASQTTSGNQPTTVDNGKAGADQTVSSQPIQTEPVRMNQGGQNSLDSGKNQQDTSSFNSAQVYIAPAANSSPSASFVQTLSAAPQNLTNTTATINLSQLAQGIVKHVSMMTQEGKKIVNMKLEPESLGSVSLQVVSDGGKISAQFNVGTSDARMFLESSMPQMRQMLESNGVTLAHMSVNLTGGESQSRNPQYQYKPRKYNWKYSNDPAKNAVPVGSSETSRSFGYNTMEMQA